jgi:DNA-binding transcriptional regulator YdaS (Cro superfamily)
MTLAEFIESKSMTVTALAAAMDRPISTVHGWVKGRRKPDWADIPAIERVTGGLVTAADFVPHDGPAPRAEPLAIPAETRRAVA